MAAQAKHGFVTRLCLCVSKCVFLHVCGYVHVYVVYVLKGVCVCVCICVYASVRISVCMCVFVYLSVHVFTHSPIYWSLQGRLTGVKLSRLELLFVCLFRRVGVYRVRVRMRIWECMYLYHLSHLCAFFIRQTLSKIKQWKIIKLHVRNDFLVLNPAGSPNAFPLLAAIR